LRRSTRGRDDDAMPPKKAAPRNAAPKNVAAKRIAKKRSMSDSHKAALAVGRDQGRQVRRYIEALEATKPRRGRKRTTETVAKRLAAVEAELSSAVGLDKVHLVQELMDLQAELAQKTESVDMAALESGFVEAAREYGDRKGLTYAAWRAVGVPANVLRAAGIARAGA
jgi:hypothetical protein